MSETTDREARAEKTYARLFGPRDTSAPDNDPEFGRMLRTFIFGDVFTTGDLNDATRELITVTVLATLNTLNQFKAHTRAALKVGVTPVELREAVYQLAPFIGFPRTLNAVAASTRSSTPSASRCPCPRRRRRPTPTGTRAAARSKSPSTARRSPTNYPMSRSRG